MARNPNPHQDPLRCPECGGGLNGEDLAYGLVCDRCGVRVAGPFEDAHDVPDYVSVEEEDLVDGRGVGVVMRRPRKNPLLVRPPRHVHPVQGEVRITKHGFPDPRIGVHTATDKNLAAGYAYMAWEGVDHGYPVVVTLDVHGLRAEPDVDAVLWWFEKYGDGQAREALKELREGVDPWRVVETMHRDTSEPQNTVTGHFVDIAFHGESVDWEKILEMPDVLARAVSGDHDAVRRVLVAGFPQRRYMVDFDLDRVISIETFRPWRDVLVPGWVFEDLDLEDEEGMAPVARDAIEDEKAGLELVSEDDIDHFEPTYKTLYTGVERRTMLAEYHGTTSDSIIKAFPRLDLPDVEGSGGWRRFW